MSLTSFLLHNIQTNVHFKRWKYLLLSWLQDEQLFLDYGVIVMVFNATFNNISVAVSFIGGGNRSTQRKPPTCRYFWKQRKRKNTHSFADPVLNHNKQGLLQ